MRKSMTLAAAAIAASLAAAAPANAQGPAGTRAPGGFYFGVGAGWSNVSVEDDDNYYYDDCCYYYDYDYDYDQGEEDTAFSAHIGFRFSPYFATELAYVDAGQPHWDHRDVYSRGLDEFADTEVDLEVQAVQLSALAILPAALSLGAIMNETVISSTRGWLNPAARSSADSPVNLEICLSPQAAITRFSPVSGTTSAMVATAASASSSGVYAPPLSA